MAIDLATQWEVRTAGNTNNGGGFRVGASGVDRCQQDSPHAILTTAATIHTTTTMINVPSGEHTVHANDIGNIFQISGGTATVKGFYEITAVDTTNNRWTLDRNPGNAGQTASGRMGGALDALTKFTSGSGVAVAGNRVWVKNDGTYSVAASQTFSVAGSSGLPIVYQGYTTTRGDTGRPTMQCSAVSVAIFNVTGANYKIRNFILDGNSQSSSRGMSLDGNFCSARFVKATGCALGGIRLQAITTRAWNCEATNCAASPLEATAGATFIDCIAHGNPTRGLVSAGGKATFLRCIAANNTGATSDGFQVTSTQGAEFMNCVAYGNGRDGLRTTAAASSDGMTILNSIFYGNAGFGINSATTNYSAADSLNVDYNAFGSNTSGARNNLPTGDNDVTLSGNPFTNAGSNDFSLNNTAGAGASLRAAGFPGALAVGGTGYLDIGVLQHADPVGGGSGGGLRLVGRGGLVG